MVNKKLCSEIIIDFLVDKKIDRIFDLSGGMIAFLEDEISKRDNIDCVPMHHEQAAGFAAEGYSRKSQNFGVAIATSGPGATNLLTAVGSSYFDSIPTLFITGQVNTENIKKSKDIRQEGFQETDIVNMVKPITKYCSMILKPDRLLYELEKAHFIMKDGRQGSVLLDIPIDVQRSEFNLNKSKNFIGSKEHARMLEKNKIDEKIYIKVNKLEKLLSKAKAPLVIIGHGIRLSNTMDDLKDFVERNNLPVVTSLLGIDSFEYGNKLIGFIGSNGNRDANIIFANADVIIALGTRLDIRQTGDSKFFNPEAKIIHIDIEKQSINYKIKSFINFHMNLIDFFKYTKKIKTPKKANWISFIDSVQNNFSRILSYENKVDANTFIHELSLFTPNKANIIIDVGQNQMWTAQSWKIKNGQRLISSGGMGAMGFSIPASIGTWYADQKSKLITICGDGGLQINIQEMETVSRNKIPMKLFIMNNNSLGMVREFQDLYFNKNYQSTVIGYGCPDLKKISNAYNFDYIKIENLKNIQSKLDSIFKHDRPTLIEVSLEITATLEPKLVYGHKLDDQSPYLNNEQKEILNKLKSDLKK